MIRYDDRRVAQDLFRCPRASQRRELGVNPVDPPLHSSYK